MGAEAPTQQTIKLEAAARCSAGLEQLDWPLTEHGLAQGIYHVRLITASGYDESGILGAGV